MQESIAKAIAELEQLRKKVGAIEKVVNIAANIKGYCPRNFGLTDQYECKTKDYNDVKSGRCSECWGNALVSAERPEAKATTEHQCFVCKFTVKGLEPDAPCPKCGNQMVVHDEEIIRCPKCNSADIEYREEYPDTDMNEMVLICNDCGFNESQPEGSE